MKKLETAINWFYERKGKVSYSMASRNGSKSYDCSSAVYYALKSAGLLPQSIGIGNTDSLFGDLERNGWTTTNSPSRGCIFIWGKRGASGGRYGHTGIFTDATTIIHCNSSGNGITLDNYTARRSRAGNPPATIYVNNNLVDEVEPDEPEPVRFKNIGELVQMGIKNNKVYIEAWHYSYDKANRSVQFVNAANNNIIATVTPQTVVMNDLKETYPDQTGIENSGFYAELSVANGTSVYIKSVLTGNGETDELIYPQIITFEKAFDIDTDDYAARQDSFFYEIIKNGKVIYRDNKIYNTLSWTIELMDMPNTTLTLPIEVSEYLTGREEIKIYINNKVFHGIVIEIELDKSAEQLEVFVQHVICEWEYRQISTNLAAKNRTINDIYSTLDFRYPGWNMEFLDGSATEIIDYVYSRQSKLEGLTKTCELTDDIFWRVGFNYGRNLQLGRFGEKKNYIFSTRPSGGINIKIIDEPVITHDFESVINIATVYGEKSDSGMSSMSLREVYLEPSAQEEGFPVLILNNSINNERNYDYIGFTSLAPNNEIEYTVMDEESILLENGIVIEGTFAFNDLAPFNVDSDEITDEDRAKSAKMAYNAAVKKLKQSRRREIISLTVQELPYNIMVGDKIRLIYDNLIYLLGDCSNYFKKILSIDDWFYITEIEYNIDENGVETNTVNLEKNLHTQRETDYQ